MTEKNISQGLLLELPIDQYGRYQRAHDIIKKLQGKRTGPAKILDIGGYRGSLHRFFKPGEAEITVLDVYDVQDKQYVKGDALAIPFADETFDYVVSFEVFEHIKRADRKKYITEALRVSKGPFLLSAPFAGQDGEVAAAEKAVNGLWRQIHGQDHPWLEEHISYKIPQTTELETILDAQKASFIKWGNNDVTLWTLLQSYTFLNTTFKTDTDNKKLLGFYNLNSHIMDSKALAYYRYVYFIGKTGFKIRGAEFKEPQVSARQKAATLDELIVRLFKALQKDLQTIIEDKNEEVAANQRSLKRQHALVDSLRRELQQEKEKVLWLTENLETLESSKAWRVARKLGTARSKVKKPFKG